MDAVTTSVERRKIMLIAILIIVGLNLIYTGYLAISISQLFKTLTAIVKEMTNEKIH